MDGIINVYKEKGWTSFDVVAKLRRVLGEKKIGHTGTLDPDATGVLPVCVGKATKVCELLTEKEKSYRTVMLLGKTTDTQDISGKVLQEKEIGNDITPEKIRLVMENFVGEYMQTPPMFSALKVNGKKLYELAREGKTIERKPRKVFFYEITVEKIELPCVVFQVTCSKGTYIRTLCEDIGNQLGCGGCMQELERTRSGIFSLEESKTIDQIQEFVDNNKIADILIPVDSIFPHLMGVKLPSKFDKLLHNGNCFSYDCMKQARETEAVLKAALLETRIRIYDSQDAFIGIYENQKERKMFQPLKIFYGK